MLRSAAHRDARARGLSLSSAEVLSPAVVLRALSAQFFAGGALALLWALLPPQSGTGGYGWVAALALAAVAFSPVLWGLSRSSHRTVVLSRLAHLSLFLGQVIIGAGHAATGDPASPLLFLFLWTTPYAGLFAPRVRWTHVGLSALAAALAVVAMSGPLGSVAVAQYSFMITAVIVATLVVSRMTARLQHVASHDTLTGLANRLLLANRTAAALGRYGDRSGGVIMILIDLDRFKLVNDSFGHEVGDALLTEFAPRLEELVDPTLGPAGLVARLGGDEFVLLYEDPDSTLDLASVLARLSRVWEQPVEVFGHRLFLSGSAGVVLAEPGATPQSLLRDADAAMYHAKALGAGQVAVFEPDLTARSTRLVAIEQGLCDALERGELALHYQPLVGLTGSEKGQILGVEGLLRWTSAELGAVSPEEFIPVAESTGLIHSLGSWVLEQGVSDLADWIAEGVVAEPFHLAINVSAHQLTEQLPDEVAEILARHRVPVSFLGLELTESAAMQHEAAREVLRRLHGLGICLLLDDFGTGWSSLSNLRELPFDVIKIDRAFVARMVECDQDKALVIAVVALSLALDMQVVAEGVETSEQAAALAACGCSIAQGYLFARPASAAAVLPLLARGHLELPRTVSSHGKA